MSSHAWVSNAWADSTLILYVDTDISKDREADAIAGEKLSQAGKPVPAYLCPTTIWGDDAASFFKTMPHLFLATGQWIVSDRAAHVLRQFDLGGGSLYPVEGVFQKDRKTRVPGEFFCWIVGNSKTALDKAASRNLRKKSSFTPWYHMPLPLEDDDVAIESIGNDGPATWIDPTLFHSIFLSGNLGDALNKAGLAEAFRLHRCRVTQ